MELKSMCRVCVLGLSVIRCVLGLSVMRCVCRALYPGGLHFQEDALPVEDVEEGPAYGDVCGPVDEWLC